jgi:hypothetical protein
MWKGDVRQIAKDLTLQNNLVRDDERSTQYYQLSKYGPNSNG